MPTYRGVPTPRYRIPAAAKHAGEPWGHSTDDIRLSCPDPDSQYTPQRQQLDAAAYRGSLGCAEPALACRLSCRTG